MVGYREDGGFQVDDVPNADPPLGFLDNDFRDPDLDRFLRRVRELEPAAAVIVDAYTADDVASRKFKRLDSYWKSELQKPEARDETFFVFDLDDVSRDAFDQLQSTLREHTAIKTRTETPNGYHIVTEPFNYNEMETELPVSVGVIDDTDYRC